MTLVLVRTMMTSLTLESWTRPQLHPKQLKLMRLSFNRKNLCLRSLKPHMKIPLFMSGVVVAPTLSVVAPTIVQPPPPAIEPPLLSFILAAIEPTPLPLSSPPPM